MSDSCLDGPAGDANDGGEAPLDMVVPAAMLALATVVLGVLTTVIVTHVLEPGV